MTLKFSASAEQKKKRSLTSKSKGSSEKSSVNRVNGVRLFLPIWLRMLQICSHHCGRAHVALVVDVKTNYCVSVSRRRQFQWKNELQKSNEDFFWAIRLFISRSFDHRITTSRQFDLIDEFLTWSNSMISQRPKCFSVSLKVFQLKTKTSNEKRTFGRCQRISWTSNSFLSFTVNEHTRTQERYRLTKCKFIKAFHRLSLDNFTEWRRLQWQNWYLEVDKHFKGKSLSWI